LNSGLPKLHSASKEEEINLKTGKFRILNFFIGADCQREYEIKKESLIEEIQETAKLEENLSTKQQRYIKREQEYRKTIEELQEEIKKNSINPFKIEGKGPEVENDEIEENFRYVPGQKSKEIVKDFREIIDIIDLVQVNTAKTLLNQKKDYCKILNAKYNQLQQKIDQEKEKTGENTADFKQREKELKENLQTMTQIAQRIDNENISLIK